MGKTTAIVLAAGSGKRMNSDTKKQYLLIKGKPLLYYSLMAFEKSAIIDEIVLVTSVDDIEYVKEEIVEKYHINKVSVITEGGKERTIRSTTEYVRLRIASMCLSMMAPDRLLMKKYLSEQWISLLSVAVQ